MLLLLMPVDSTLAARQINAESRQRARAAGVEIGVLKPGHHNAITDVATVRVGHTTVVRGDSVRTGVTAILPHSGNLYQQKVSAAVYVGNGFGKLIGSTQIEELGELEAPVLLTNTLNVHRVADAVVNYMLALPGNEQVRSINVVVGETNDGFLNDIRGRHVNEGHVRQAIQSASSGAVAEGAVGAGTGTMCLGFKGGIGTASRVLPASLGGYTIGVLVQSNFGGILQINGAPVGRELGTFAYQSRLPYPDGDGSIMIIVATDAPLDARNLQRLAKRALFGMARTGGFASNGSGDYVIAFSTATPEQHRTDGVARVRHDLLGNEAISPLFLAAVEATEEAIINSLFMATTTNGRAGNTAEALPLPRTLEILRHYQALNQNQTLPGWSR